MRFFVNFSARDTLLVHDNIALNLQAGDNSVFFRERLREPHAESLVATLASSDAQVYALTPASLEE